jgi:UDP-glucose 4-epimerase
LIYGIDTMAMYLITGGCGFIGSHLADALVERGDTVRILDDLSNGKRSNPPPECEVIVGDIGEQGVVARAMAGVDGVWHLAAVASVVRANEAWVETNRTNLAGTIQVFDAARGGGGRGPIPVVYASSAAVYGDNPNVPLSESERLLPLNAYGVDKLGSELHGRVATLVHGVPTVGLRFFNVYGVRQDPHSPYSGVVSIFSDRISSGESITIFGDGGQTRDFIHVSDVVKFLLVSMGRGVENPEVYNVATGVDISIKKLAEALMEVSGRTVPVYNEPFRVGDIRTSVGDPTLGEENLQLKAQTALLTGLRQLVVG